MDGPLVERHRTAIGRAALSRPLRLALEHSVLHDGMSVMDYGCGRGDDVARLEANGFQVAGWDPHYRPDGERSPSDVVNLGYVLNVIESPAERHEVLRAAWSLAKRAMVVAAQVWMHDQSKHKVPFSDGVLTGRGTFQRYFEQAELADLIRTVLGVEPVPAALGVFFVFRDAADAMRFQVGFLRRRVSLLEPAHRPDREARRRAGLDPAEFEALLAPLRRFLAVHGRPPEDDEVETKQLVDAFGSFGRATGWLRRTTAVELLAQYQRERSDDLLVYLALSQFGGRPAFTTLPVDLQRDIRAHLTNYTRACEQADKLLFSLRDYHQIRKVATTSTVGKRLPDALYVHRAGLERLPTLLRLVEGCARGFIGEVEGANIIKIHLLRPAVGYLAYPDFDSDPHPALAQAVDVDLAQRSVRSTDYSVRENPPILHRRELFVPSDYPGATEMAAITAEEEAAGLYTSPAEIGTRAGWNALLARAKGEPNT